MAAETVPRSLMLRTVFAKTIREQRRALVWWAVGFIGAVFVYAAFWPNVRSNAGQFNAYIEKFPEAIRNMMGGVDFGTPEGYLESELFSFMMPILLLVYAIGAGARAIAGEEEAGSLDLLLSTPVKRRKVLLDKFWAMIATAFLLVALMWASVLVLGRPYDLRLGLAGLTAASLNLFLLGAAFGSIALAVGTATGNKGLAVGATSGLALVTFILKTLAPSVEALKPFRILSPFYYYIGHEPITNGFNGTDVVVLAAIGLVALAIALVSFDRRDLAA